MPNEELIREIAIRACREALQEKSQGLAEDVAKRMALVLASQPQQRQRIKELRDGSVLIASARTQTEALETLLAASSVITPACGLMILRGAQATGWSCHGLTTLDNFKRATLECTRGVVAKVINSGAATLTRVSELDSVFTAILGLKSSAQVLLVPVLLKQRVAALLIALPHQSDDLEGLELLVQVAQLTLDVQAYRKAPLPSAEESPRSAEPNRPGAETRQPASASESSESVHATGASIAVAVPAIPAQALPGGVVPPQPSAPVLDEAHEKARRFAKLLVEEIMLYNQTKVGEGRARGDLYSRLREDIEKSRAAYNKRAGGSVGDVDYFSQELMRILADNNPTVMGQGFPG